MTAPTTAPRDRPIGELRNLGKRSAAWLIDAGVTTEGDLRRIGPAAAYARVKARHPVAASLNLLWSLQAALLDMPWQHLPADIKDALKRDLSV